MAAEQRAYDKLVEDVTINEAKAKMHSEYLPTSKLQIGQGVHMAVTMGLGYALGSQFGAALSTTNPLIVRATAACPAKTPRPWAEALPAGAQQQYPLTPM